MTDGMHRASPGASLDPAHEHEALLAKITAQVDADYRAGSRRSTRTDLHVYGVRVPVVRSIAREWAQSHKKLPCSALLPVVERLWDGDSQEERALAMELLRCYPRCIRQLDWSRFERWRHLVDNWALADLLAAKILAAWLLADLEARLAHLQQLIASDALWSRRLALVATTPINRGHAGVTLPDLTLAFVERVKHEREPMMTKAVSWALRELTKSHPDRVAAYVAENRESLAPHVVREVDNKLRTGLKHG